MIPKKYSTEWNREFEKYIICEEFDAEEVEWAREFRWYARAFRYDFQSNFEHFLDDHGVRSSSMEMEISLGYQNAVEAFEQWLPNEIRKRKIQAVLDSGE